MDKLLLETVKYLIWRGVWSYGFCKFTLFKKIISYHTGITDAYLLRKIFILLIEEGFFEKHKNIKRSYMYKFITPKYLEG